MKNDFTQHTSNEESSTHKIKGGDSLSLIVHQLRSPLVSIRLVLQVLLENESHNLTKEQIRLLEQASVRVGRMSDLTNSLLQNDALESSLLKPDLHLGSVEKLLNDTLSLLSMQFNEKKHTVNKKYAKDPVRIYFDNKKLQEALFNILDNAIKYTPQSGTITLTTAYTDETVRISISDTGVGVREQDIPLIFEKYMRMPNAEDINPNGLGLGLYIARKVVERHKGSLVYEPNTPKGSTFIVTLPTTV